MAGDVSQGVLQLPLSLLFWLICSMRVSCRWSAMLRCVFAGGGGMPVFCCIRFVYLFCNQHRSKLHLFWQIRRFHDLSLQAESISQKGEQRRLLKMRAFPLSPHLNKPGFVPSADDGLCMGQRCVFEHCLQPFGKIQPHFAKRLEGLFMSNILHSSAHSQLHQY